MEIHSYRKSAAFEISLSPPRFQVDELSNGYLIVKAVDYYPLFSLLYTFIGHLELKNSR